MPFSVRARRMIARSFTMICSGVFLFMGCMKLISAPDITQAFLRWGYPIWMLYAVGAFEVCAVIALWFRQTRGYAALLLSGLMVSALVTHMRFQEGMAFPVTMLFLTIMLSWIYQHEGSGESHIPHDHHVDGDEV